MAERKRPLRSIAWSYFTPVNDNVANCNVCCKDVRCCNNTTNLFKHLKKHEKEYSEVERRREEGNASDKNSSQSPHWQSFARGANSQVYIYTEEGDLLPGTFEQPSESTTPSTSEPPHPPQAVETPVQATASRGRGRGRPRKIKAEQEGGELTEDPRGCLSTAVGKPLDEDEHFFMGLIPTIKRLTPKKRANIKVKFMQMLIDAEFGDDEQGSVVTGQENSQELHTPTQSQANRIDGRGGL